MLTLSQPITQSDHKRGVIRISFKSFGTLPVEPQDATVEFGGRTVASRWNPNIRERGRSGTISVGKEASSWFDVGSRTIVEYRAESQTFVLTSIGLHPSSSAAQRAVENVLILRSANGADLLSWTSVAAETKVKPPWNGVRPDGCWFVGKGSSRTLVVAEAYARVAPLESGNRAKLCKDVLKLSCLVDEMSNLEVRTKAVLVVPKQLETELSSERSGWVSAAIHKHVELVTVDLGAGEVELLEHARERQKMGVVTQSRRGQ